MNFEEWFKQSGINDRTYFTSKEVWDACKNEVLRILKKNTEKVDGLPDNINIDAINEIEKL